MLTQHCQRWRDRRGTYRPAGEPIDTKRYEITVLETDRLARSFVERHHYSGSYVAALLRVGLYRGDELVGVAVLSQPASQAALDAALPLPGVLRAELGRFVLVDDVPANGESWFLGRVFELARRRGFEALVAHSDPQQRFAYGRTVFGGHIGTIYQGTNARYRGLTPARTWRLFPNGAVFSARAWSKLRARERGWQYAVDQLVAHGAPEPDGDWDQWVRDAVGAATRPWRHHGTHRYIWPLVRHARRLPEGRVYPKFDIGGTLQLPFARG